MKVVGIDASKDRKWIAVLLKDGRCDDHLFVPSVRQILDEWPDANAYGIDIPLDFPWTRRGPDPEADRAARAFCRSAP
jgi:Protein of unknown function (DUF429)